MKYMDNTLDEASAKELNMHIKTCNKCREEFMVYSMMMEEFEQEGLVFAPDGFEVSVMKKISAMPDIHYKAENKLDNAFCLVWGIVSTLVGIGFMLGIYRGQIIKFFSSYKILNVFVAIFEPVSEFTQSLALDIVNGLGAEFSYALGLITLYRFYVIGVIIVFSVGRLLYTKFAGQKE
jgi:hypothetical protein